MADIEGVLSIVNSLTTIFHFGADSETQCHCFVGGTICKVFCKCSYVDNQDSFIYQNLAIEQALLEETICEIWRSETYGVILATRLKTLWRVRS